MSQLSRRALARYAVNQLLQGQPVKLVARHLASVLILDKRSADTQLLLDDIAYELENNRHLAVGQISSAHELPSSLIVEVKNLIKHQTKVNQVILNQKIDKDVIGGLRLETSTRVWDKTVSHQLQQLKEITS